MKSSQLSLAFVVILLACNPKSTHQKSITSKDDRTVPVQFFDSGTYYLTQHAEDDSYGYTAKNPVKVGGVKTQEGPLNQRRYLNALLSPNGEDVGYYRAGSCCPFETPNGFMNNTGMLDRYRIYWKGSKDTLDIYINLYDEGNLLIPKGLKAVDY